MMVSLEELKTKIQNILIAKLGEPDETDLVLLKRLGQEHGLDNRQFDRLLQEIYGSINWMKIRDEREGENRISGEPIKIFETDVRSLNKLGEVLYNNRDRALKYLADDILLKANVNYLSSQNIDLAMAFTDLYHAENDQERRYLSICYRLNHKLPYRIGRATFNSLPELLTAGFQRYERMKKIEQEFRLGQLQTWLTAFGSVLLNLDPHDRSREGFLRLVYQVDAGFPFYLGDQLYYTFAELAGAAMTSIEVGRAVLDGFADRSLLVWAEALGHQEWHQGYAELFKRAYGNALLDEEEKDYLLLQELVLMMDEQIDHPALTLSQTKIENLKVAAAEPIEVPIWLHLKTAGFVKPQINLQPELRGISLDKTNIVLFSGAGKQQDTLTLMIDPQKLAKDVDYKTVIRIVSDYETIEIPVYLKAVFPRQAYLLGLAKYSFFGALFFALSRWLLAVCTGYSDQLPPQIITGNFSRALPEDYAGFYWVFIVMIFSLGAAVIMIRKGEKI